MQLVVELLLVVAVVSAILVLIRTRSKVEHEKKLKEHYAQVAEEYRERLDVMESELLLHAERAIRDPLTNLYDRGGLFLKAKEEEVRSVRYSHVYSVIFIDLDDFKAVNDNYGHTMGDLVLTEVAKVFERETREDLDVVSRYGGDEFIILLPETGRKMANKTARRIRRAVANHRFTENGEEIEGLQVTISLGIATCKPGCDFNNLLKEVDDAMYAAKQNGKNMVSW